MTISVVTDLINKCLVFFILLISGCTTQAPTKQNSIMSDVVLLGRISSIKDVTFAQGDVLFEWKQYRLDILGSDVEHVEFFSSGQNCAIGEANKEIYAVFLICQNFPTEEEKGKKYESVLCTKLDVNAEHYVDEYFKNMLEKTTKPKS